MGAIANAIAAYAQPLIDQTDGSADQMNRAMLLAQLCWNVALVPEEERDAAIERFKPALETGDGEFAEFRQQVILPMIQRHHEMFPQMHERSQQASSAVRVAPSAKKDRPVTDRYAPCPCGSGRKYKWCCGARK